MPKVALTDRFVAHAKAQGVPQLDYFDESTPGLALRVSSAGRKTWTFHYTSPRDGKRARLTLGTYPGDQPRQRAWLSHRGPWRH